MTFRIANENEDIMRDTLTAVYDALKEKGYNPINQIVGYILSEDPTYITTHNNARSLIRKIDRDELLAEMVRSYLGWYNRRLSKKELKAEEGVKERVFKILDELRNNNNFSYGDTINDMITKGEVKLSKRITSDSKDDELITLRVDDLYWKKW